MASCWRSSAAAVAQRLISQKYPPARRFTAPAVVFQPKYPVGIVPLDESAVQTHSPPSASRQNSSCIRPPDMGGPLIVVGLPFW